MITYTCTWITPVQATDVTLYYWNQYNEYVEGCLTARRRTKIFQGPVANLTIKSVTKDKFKQPTTLHSVGDATFLVQD
jgi:hypothetical protein